MIKFSNLRPENQTQEAYEIFKALQELEVSTRYNMDRLEEQYPGLRELREQKRKDRALLKVSRQESDRQ